MEMGLYFLISSLTLSVLYHALLVVHRVMQARYLLSLILQFLYLQYQQIASINWGKLEQASEGIVRKLANATTTIIGNTDNNIGVVELAITNFSIPVTSSLYLLVLQLAL
jgi:uncharacterized membrane protein (Fun14 family)